MTGCTSVHVTHQAQLEYQWGGRYGYANCNPCSGGMVGEIDSCGVMRFTGAQIRAASTEPVPDPKSPGLNHTQVSAALRKLSGGKIALDVHNGYSWDSTRKRATEGAPFQLGIKRSVLVNAGQGYGDPFAGGHDIACWAVAGTPWFDDPLTGKHQTTWETLKRAAGALVINPETDAIAGYGKAWVSFGRSSSPQIPWWPTYIEAPDAHATFAVRFNPGRYPRLDEYGNHIGWFIGGENGFTAYGNSRWTHPGGHLIGKLITDRPGYWIDTTTAAHYWSET